VSADDKYKDKVVSISGVASDMGTELMGHPYVMLDSSDLMSPQIQCVFNDGQKDAVAGLNKGDTVTIVGKMNGMLGYVDMDDCTLQ
jgi:hypothetical protein